MLRIVDNNFEAIIDDSGDIKIIKEKVTKTNKEEPEKDSKKEENK